MFIVPAACQASIKLCALSASVVKDFQRLKAHTTRSAHARRHTATAFHGAHHLGHAAFGHLFHHFFHLHLLLDESVNILYLQAATFSNTAFS